MLPIFLFGRLLNEHSHSLIRSTDLNHLSDIDNQIRLLQAAEIGIASRVNVRSLD